MVEMVVESVRVNLQTYHRVVVLKQKDSDATCRSGSATTRPTPSSFSSRT